MFNTGRDQRRPRYSVTAYFWHASSGSDTLTLKGGSLDWPLDLGPAVHVWTSRKLSGVVIPAGATQFAEESA